MRQATPSSVNPPVTPPLPEHKDGTDHLHGIYSALRGLCASIRQRSSGVHGKNIERCSSNIIRAVVQPNQPSSAQINAIAVIVASPCIYSIKYGYKFQEGFGLITIASIDCIAPQIGTESRVVWLCGGVGGPTGIYALQNGAPVALLFRSSANVCFQPMEVQHPILHHTSICSRSFRDCVTTGWQSLLRLRMYVVSCWRIHAEIK